MQNGKTRIVVLGGGFGGVTTAQALSKEFKGDRSVEITLINRDNHFLFVPLLASAAAGSLQPMNVVMPIRPMIPKAKFRAEEIMGIDVEKKVVSTVSPTTGHEAEVPFDHLVLALGNVVNLSRMPGVAQHAMTIKTLGDAFAIRNHVLNLFEAAEIETNPDERRRLLTFVVVGGGFSGVEMCGELNDLVREVARNYPDIGQDEARVILVHSRDRILPEVSDSLADYALRQLRKRGVDTRLGLRLASATPDEAVFQGDVTISTRTLIVAVGNAPPPALAALNVEKERGKIVVDEYMRVPDHPGLWALGDNAIVPNVASKDGSPSPPTAQYALRQGKRLAKNIAAAVRGGDMEPFGFGGLGVLCLVGHGAGVGEMPFGIKLSGFIGWFMWRNVYWSKFPSLSRRLQIGLDWLLEIFLPRELATVQLARTKSINQAHYEPGQVIVKQGERANHFYLVSDGEVEVVRQENGEEVTLAQLGKGEYFGEMELLSNSPRYASIRCLTPVDVISFSREDFGTLTGTWGQLTESLQEVADARAAMNIATLGKRPTADAS